MNYLKAFIMLIPFFLFSPVRDSCESGLLSNVWVANASASESLHPNSEKKDDDDFFDDDIDFLDDEFAEETDLVADPIAFWNKTMFYFNDKFYFWALKPITKSYKVVVPEAARICVQNFFYNLTTASRLANCILQAKGLAAGAEFSRFLINSTIGILGFGDPAEKYILKPAKEDLGQTLGIYGIGNGFYIVWPLLGSSTLRDSFGIAGEYFLNPVNYVKPAEAASGINCFNIVNKTSFRIGDYESLKDAALMPYEAFRNAYIQHRKDMVKK